MSRYLSSREGIQEGFDLRCSLHSFVPFLALILSRASRGFLADSISFCTDVCAAFAASLLVRLARIFPSELDLRQTARDVEELAKILASGSSRRLPSLFCSLFELNLTPALFLLSSSRRSIRSIPPTHSPFSSTTKTHATSLRPRLSDLPKRFRLRSHSHRFRSFLPFQLHQFQQRIHSTDTCGFGSDESSAWTGDGGGRRESSGRFHD